MTKTCATCGKTFEAGILAKYCSKLCKDRHSRPLVPLLDKICVFCGKAFKTKMPKARCCSSMCADRLRRGWTSLADFEKAQAARKSAAFNKQHERDRNGLTLDEIQEVIDAQDGDLSQLWKRSQSWTNAQHKYAKRRYEEMHGLCNT